MPRPDPSSEIHASRALSHLPPRAWAAQGCRQPQRCPRAHDTAAENIFPVHVAGSAPSHPRFPPPGKVRTRRHAAAVPRDPPLPDAAGCGARPRDSAMTPDPRASPHQGPLRHRRARRCPGRRPGDAAASILLEGNPGHRQDHHRPAVPAGGRGARRARRSTSPCRKPSRAARRRRLAWLDAATGDRRLRAGAAREPARRRPAAEPALFLRPRARRDHAADLRGGGARPADRVVLDSLSEIRLLAQSSLRYRRQILAMKHYFARHGATVLMLDDLTTDAQDKTVHSVAHGVIRLEELAPDYGAERRRLRVIKYRGQALSAAASTTSPSRPAACEVFPRLVAAEHRVDFTREPAGQRHRGARPAAGRRRRARLEHAADRPGRIGKSLIGAAIHRRGRGARREGGALRLRRGAGPAARPRQGDGHRPRGTAAAGGLLLEQVDAAELSPGEFAAPGPPQRRRRTASARSSIDSLNGYQAAMPDERFLILHIHELLQYLNRQGATTFLPSRSTGWSAT